MGTRSHSVRYFDKYFRYPLSNLHVYDSGELDQLIGHHSPKMLAEKAEIWQEISAKFYTTWKKSSKFIYNQQTNNKKDNSTNSNPTKKIAWATTAAAAKAKVLRLQEVKLTVKILLLLLHVAKEF